MTDNESPKVETFTFQAEINQLMQLIKDALMIYKIQQQVIIK